MTIEELQRIPLDTDLLVLMNEEGYSMRWMPMRLEQTGTEPNTYNYYVIGVGDGYGIGPEFKPRIIHWYTMTEAVDCVKRMSDLSGIVSLAESINNAANSRTISPWLP